LKICKEAKILDNSIELFSFLNVFDRVIKTIYLLTFWVTFVNFSFWVKLEKLGSICKLLKTIRGHFVILKFLRAKL